MRINLFVNPFRLAEFLEGKLIELPGAYNDPKSGAGWVHVSIDLNEYNIDRLDGGYFIITRKFEVVKDT